ncbi:hypothetical protein H4R35_006160 [Dimargaris xerosporica]|nr:hypothetical protein H4R35_006160 [Dimargaris xerosporica]
MGPRPKPQYPNAQAKRVQESGSRKPWGSTTTPMINFSTQSIHVLRRYRQVHKLNVKVRAPKEELCKAVMYHFTHRTVNEAETLALFLYSTRTKDKLLRCPVRHS